VREDKKVLLPKNWIHAFLYSKLTTRAWTPCLLLLTMRCTT
jgi:hypothetical protein